MKELTDNAVINDAVYEMSLNGSYPIIKLAVATVEIKAHEEMAKHDHGCGCGCHRFPEAKEYHFTQPSKEEKVLYSQPLPAGGDIPVYNGGKVMEENSMTHRITYQNGESRVSTSKKVVARGPLWIWAAIAVGLPPQGSSHPYLVVETVGSYGSDDTTEGEIIGVMEGKQREITARLVRRAHLLQLPVASIRTEYKYTFVEPGEIGRAKVKEG